VKPLSPQAQAVVNASMVPVQHNMRAKMLAAALRTAADQVVPEAPIRDGSAFMRGVDERGAEIRCNLLAIAAELEQ